MTELKGWHVLSILMAFFGVTIAVNAYFIAAALSSSTGEYQRKSYLQGLRYNQVIAARESQLAIGWTAELSTTRVAKDVWLIAIRIVDRSGRPVSNLTMTGDLRRPVQAAMDRALTFENAGDGHYRASAANLQPGKWQVVVAAGDARNRSAFRAEKDLWLR